MKSLASGRLKLALYVTVASSFLAAAGCRSTATPEAPDSPAAITVSTDRIASIDLPARIDAGGIVQAGATAQITSRVMAPIQDVLVRAGDRVTRGQPLVVLDSREVTANAERADATLAAATEASRAAESRIAAAQSTLRLAQATHARVRALHEKRSATAQELDQAVASLEAAEAQALTARSESAAAASARETARAAAAAASVARSYAVLTAPFDGVVAERSADPGSLATPGSPLLIVEESGPARLDVRLDDSRAAWVRQGQSAAIRLDDDESASWTTTSIVEVGRSDPASHTFLVKLALPPNVSARTGSFGRARFTGESRRTLTAPAASVVRRAGLTFVFVVGADTQARLRPVIVGERDDNRTEVLAGVSDGDVVIVSPPPAVTDGSRVIVGSRAPSPHAGEAHRE